MIRGKVTTKYGNDVNTDNIISADLLQEFWDKESFRRFAFRKYDPSFIERSTDGNNVIVAGSNFGCGSSREQAIYAIQYNGVEYVVAQIDPRTGKAFPDIFYRNALNNGLPLIALPDVSDLNINDMLELDLRARQLTNASTGRTYRFEMPHNDVEILLAGGLVGIAKKELEERLSKK